MTNQTLAPEAEKENANLLNDAEISEPVPPSDIVAYNELRSCADLFRLYEAEKLEIQPDFQREVVWKANDQTRFIDSLVKQLPIPSMCFSLDYKTQKWKVVDGLQRMSSIISFLGSAPWKLKDLEDIHPMLRGESNASLRKGNEDQRRLFATVQDVSIPITVLRCDYSQESHMHYLFTIFHRLNSGGVRLNNQEIRNCIYSGGFNDLLKDFDKTNKDWAIVKKRIWGSSSRFRSIELLLRALAFYENLPSYDGNLAKFLNKFMHDKMDSSKEELENYRLKLTAMAEGAASALDRNASHKVSMTFIEAALVGLLRNENISRSKYASILKKTFNLMLADNTFSEAARYAIASETNVRKRLDSAITFFSE